MADLRAVVVAAAWLVACSKPGAAPVEDAPPRPSPAVVAAPVPVQPAPVPSHRVQLDGRAFPDGVLALTWDDGPDEGTLGLASYLAEHRIGATFFVVEEWVKGVSEEPGQGARAFETGYRSLPILRDLVARGHRLGNHTVHHVLLAGAKPAVVLAEVGEAQRGIDPFLANELRLLRAPGGAWDDAAAAVVDTDPVLAALVGPVRWDVDGKDWEGSLYCDAKLPRDACEPRAPGGASRVRAEVVARRTLDGITAAGRGIVLFHDRVGDVGSRYALDVARLVVPALVDRGFVFAAPVLAFSTVRPRLADGAARAWFTSLDGPSVAFTDVDADGRADLCGVAAGRLSCARSVSRPREDGAGMPVTAFVRDEPWANAHPLAAPPRPTAAPPVATRMRGDLNGDGREDECVSSPERVACALAGPQGPKGASTWLDARRADLAPFRGGRYVLADVNGDGRADLCVVGAADVACGLAP